ncbi:hypothetical protein HCN51_57210 [Nonomuraea sp. FMUSA5-5]|uniref:Secreted protein n=1 Tax=Nonomuraea composti TaxID=2720023 RepID=A0ABX1BQK2_9ACTN|nr:hypothetical protein [Nonomuraea sp. FMUSA5-5]NJP98864.1 hypothetical protein [Nonomuraea sp. FMUSA5-5]
MSASASGCSSTNVTIALVVCLRLACSRRTASSAVMAYAGGSPNMSALVALASVARVPAPRPSCAAASVSSSTRARCHGSVPGTSASSA